MSVTKKIIITALILATLVFIYFSSYLPFAKSEAYINAVRGAQQMKSIDDFKKIFDSVFNFYSPVGDEEVIKFLSNDVLSLIGQEGANESIARLIVEYIEPKFFSNNVRHMLTGARMYEVLWRRWGKEEYYKKAESYYLKTYEIGPKLPPVLYGMISIYYAHRDFDKAKDIAEQVLQYWPNDERVKPFVTPAIINFQ